MITQCPEIKRRSDILVEARRWIGTPYIHQASVLGKGCDCLGLVRGIWRSIVGPEPEAMPEYSQDWGEVSLTEPMLEAAQKWFVPISLPDAKSGDLVLFRWKNTAIIKHAGILAGERNFIHAYEKAGVVETTLGPQWKKRIAAAFQFPTPEFFIG